MRQIRNFFSKSTRKKRKYRGECWVFLREVPNPRDGIEEKRQTWIFLLALETYILCSSSFFILWHFLWLKPWITASFKEILKRLDDIHLSWKNTRVFDLGLRSNAEVILFPAFEVIMMVRTQEKWVSNLRAIFTDTEVTLKTDRYAFPVLKLSVPHTMCFCHSGWKVRSLRLKTWQKMMSGRRKILPPWKGKELCKNRKKK